MRREGEIVMMHGVVAGFLGATVLAVWFLLIDWTLGVPLMTPSLLGSLLIRGEAEVAQIHTAGLVVYTGLHYMLFVFVGVAAAALAVRAEARPHVLSAGLLFLAVLQAFTLGFTTVLAETFQGTIRWWAIALGNLLAIGAMFGYLGSLHPQVARRLNDEHVFDGARYRQGAARLIPISKRRGG